MLPCLQDHHFIFTVILCFPRFFLHPFRLFYFLSLSRTSPNFVCLQFFFVWDSVSKGSGQLVQYGSCFVGASASISSLGIFATFNTLCIDTHRLHLKVIRSSSQTLCYCSYASASCLSFHTGESFEETFGVHSFLSFFGDSCSLQPLLHSMKLWVVLHTIAFFFASMQIALHHNLCCVLAFCPSKSEHTSRCSYSRTAHSSQQFCRKPPLGSTFFVAHVVTPRISVMWWHSPASHR